MRESQLVPLDTYQSSVAAPILIYLFQNEICINISLGIDRHFISKVCEFHQYCLLKIRPNSSGSV